jgi:hypothetical protein
VPASLDKYPSSGSKLSGIPLNGWYLIRTYGDGIGDAILSAFKLSATKLLLCSWGGSWLSIGESYISYLYQSRA